MAICFSATQCRRSPKLCNVSLCRWVGFLSNNSHEPESHWHWVKTFRCSLIYEDTWHVDGRCSRCQCSSVCRPCNFYDGDKLVSRDRHGKLLGDSQFVPWDNAVFLETVTILLFPYDACLALPKLRTVTFKNAKFSPLHKLLQLLPNKADIPLCDRVMYTQTHIKWSLLFF
jgi:hypothetical protein